ncbi:hypothetical protein D9M70_553990 [compost metagenome]
MRAATICTSSDLITVAPLNSCLFCFFGLHCDCCKNIDDACKNAANPSRLRLGICRLPHWPSTCQTETRPSRNNLSPAIFSKPLIAGKASYPNILIQLPTSAPRPKGRVLRGASQSTIGRSFDTFFSVRKARISSSPPSVSTSFAFSAWRPVKMRPSASSSASGR